MAYERLSSIKVKGDSLDSFVENSVLMYERQNAIRNAVEEGKFNEKVLVDNISLDEQLEYRRNQLKAVTDDPAERRRIRAEMSGLKDRIEQKEFSDKYTDKLANLAEGVSSIDSIINWLEDQLVSATDQGIKDSINKELVTKKSERFQISQRVIQNQTNYALNDKSNEILNEQITKVESERAKALLAGNDELTSTYDLHIQALTKALNENTITNDIRNFAISNISGYMSATGLLDAYNGKISSASGDGAITIGDTTYASAKDFWNYQRDTYISDSSPDGFLPRFTQEQTSTLKSKYSSNTMGFNDIGTSKSAFDSLSTRPELVSYMPLIENAKIETMQTAGDLFANNIYRRYTTDLDINKALNDLNSIKGFGINVDSTYYDVINKGASIKEAEVSGILAGAQDFLNNNPGATPDQAIEAATAAGAGVTLSPTQLTATSSENIAKDFSTGAGAGAFTPDPRVTATPPNTPTAPPVVPPVTQTTPTVTPTPIVPITSQLDYGAKGTEVESLQKFLVSQGYLTQEEMDTGPGTFGPRTQTAVQKFQKSTGIVSSGDAASTGYGRVGPQTLSKIKELYK